MLDWSLQDLQRSSLSSRCALLIPTLDGESISFTLDPASPSPETGDVSAIVFRPQARASAISKC